MEKGKVRKRPLLRERDSLRKDMLPDSLRLQQRPDSQKGPVPGDSIPDPKDKGYRIPKSKP